MNKIKNFMVFAAIFLLTVTSPCSVFSKNPLTDEETKYEYINMQWWQGFNDPYLIEYIIKSIQNNYDLKISTLKVEEMRENKNIVRSGEMPSLGIGAIPALYKLPTLNNSEGLISLPIFANYEIDLFGKNRDKTKSMDKLIEIEKENERASYISIISAVGSTYLMIVKLDKLISIQEKIIKDRKEIYDLMKLSNDEGLTSTADTVNAHKSYIKSEADIIELYKLREQMLNTLAVLTGDSPENSSDYRRIDYENLMLFKTIPDFISSDIIENRPDYLKAEKILEKTGIDVRIAKKEFLPTFNIFGLLSFNSTEYLSKMNWKNSTALLAGSALLPLFTGGKKIANLKLNKNKYDQAIENYQNTNIKAIQEVNNALCNLKLNKQKYLKTMESYEDEKRNLYFSTLKYNEGIISKLDLLQKQEALTVTEKIMVNEKTELFINKISLYKATAGTDNF